MPLPITPGGGFSSSSASSSPLSAANQAPNQIQNVVNAGGGFNLGEILQPFIQGSPENGGYPITIPSRLASSGGGQLYALDQTNVGRLPMVEKVKPYFPVLLVGLAGIVAIYFLRR